jgi:hypothetical protein
MSTINNAYKNANKKANPIILGALVLDVGGFSLD